MKLFGLGVLVTLFLIGSVVSLYAGPPEMVTGGVEFTRMEACGEVLAKAEFTAHAEHNGNPAKGMFKYKDSIDREVRIDVDCVLIHRCGRCCCATFSGPVVRTNVREWEGKWIQVWVRDGGSSGRDKDLIGATIYDRDPECHPSLPPEWWEVTHGNQQIHPRCDGPPGRVAR